MGTTTIRGHMNEVTWDGRTLRAKGTNKAAHFALLGQNNVDAHQHINENASRLEQVKGLGTATKEALDLPDELVLHRDDIESVEFKPASMLTNGRVTIAAHGRKHQLHFRKKQQADFEALAAALS